MCLKTSMFAAESILCPNTSMTRSRFNWTDLKTQSVFFAADAITSLFPLARTCVTQVKVRRQKERERERKRKKRKVLEQKYNLEQIKVVFVPSPSGFLSQNLQSFVTMALELVFKWLVSLTSSYGQSISSMFHFNFGKRKECVWERVREREKERKRIPKKRQKKATKGHPVTLIHTKKCIKSERKVTYQSLEVWLRVFPSFLWHLSSNTCNFQCHFYVNHLLQVYHLVEFCVDETKAIEYCL